MKLRMFDFLLGLLGEERLEQICQEHGGRLVYLSKLPINADEAAKIDQFALANRVHVPSPKRFEYRRAKKRIAIMRKSGASYAKIAKETGYTEEYTRQVMRKITRKKGEQHE